MQSDGEENEYFVLEEEEENDVDCGDEENDEVDGPSSRELEASAFKVLLGGFIFASIKSFEESRRHLSIILITFQLCV